MDRAAPSIDRTRPPAPGRLEPFRFPEFERRELRSGGAESRGAPEMLAARWGQVPLVTVELLIPAGAQHEPGDRSGLASLTAGLLDEGVRGYSASELAARVEGLGGQLATGAAWDSAHVTIEVQERHLDEALDLLARVSLEPDLAPDELDRLLRHRRAEVRRRRALPAVLAEQRLAWAIYGDTPYGRPLIGDLESLERIDLDSVHAFYRERYHLAESCLIATGAVDPDTLAQRAAEALARADSRWATEAPSSHRVSVSEPRLEAPAADGVRVHLVDRPGAAQTELRIGHDGMERTHPDHVRFRLLNTVLGGKFTSRLNLNLRERHGFTYGVQSGVRTRIGSGPFVVSTAIATEATGQATREVLKELQRLRDEAPSAEELADAQSYLVGTFPYTLQSAGGVAASLEILAVYGLPDDTFQRFPEKVAATTRDDLLRVAREQLHPDRVSIVAVGPADELRGQLEALGPVTVVDPDWR